MFNYEVDSSHIEITKINTSCENSIHEELRGRIHVHEQG